MDGNYKVNYTDGKNKYEQVSHEKAWLKRMVKTLYVMGYFVTGIFKLEDNKWKEYEDKENQR